MRSRRDQRFTLPDGRILGFAEYGDAGGTPLFFFHGTPGARISAPHDDAALVHARVRLIAPERPGYGLSTPHVQRTLLSWSDDVAALADHLGLRRFAVAGASGGGPYALSCASALPTRVTVAGLFCSAGQVESTSTLRSLSVINRLKFGIPRVAPWLLRIDLALFGSVIRRYPNAFSRLAVQLSPSDRSVTNAEGFRDRVEQLLRESLRGGTHGLYSDLVIGSRPWGFDLRKIRVPAFLWHGEEDQMAPTSMARDLAAAIPNCTAHFLPGVGHLLLGRADVWPKFLDIVTRS
jgi:pimeloyl-ACP methyl ester carboxylesterase